MVERIDPLLGHVLDRRYKIGFRLAAGGFGAIYRATHIKSGHEVALKVLHPQLTTDAGVVARFRREGATMTTLRSPHTITAYELGEADDGTLYIVMELLLGESLFERFRAQGRFDWKRMVRIARAICDSLREAHELGIVHRDLKPTNIHLEDKGQERDFVKVLDFGIAKILQDSEFDSSDLTNVGQMIGTLDYMSPEQMVGGACTGQSDIYTLGILTYEMIAGVRPFAEAQTAAAALAAILKTVPPVLSKRVPVPHELDRILAKCLARDPLQRYRTVAELAADFDRLIAGLDIDEVTRTVAIDPTDDGLNEATMYSAPKFTTTLPPPEAKLRTAPVAAQAGRTKTPTGAAEPRAKFPPTGGSAPGRAKPPSQPPPVPTSGEYTWQGDAPRNQPASSSSSGEHTWSGDVPPSPMRPKPKTDAPRDAVDPFSAQPTTPQTPVARAKPRTNAPPDDYITTPVPKFQRPPPTPPEGLPAASPFKTTLPGAQMPPNPNARPSAPQFFPPTPYPQGPPGFPPPAVGHQPTPFPPGASPYAPQPIDDGHGSRPVLDLNAFPQQRPQGPGGYPQQPTPPPGGYPQQPPGGAFDMAQIQARDAAMRRMVWIAVLVIGAIAGIVLASQL